MNRPKNSFNPLHRDGAGNCNGLGALSYYPSTFQDYEDAPQCPPTKEENWRGPVVDCESKLAEDDFAQPREIWLHTLPKDAGQQENLVSNIAEQLAKALPEIRKKTYGMLQRSDQGNEMIVTAAVLFRRVHQDLGRQFRIATEKRAEEIEMSKFDDQLRSLKVDFQVRSARSALDKNEDLPCIPDPPAPNAGFFSGKHVFRS